MGTGRKLIGIIGALAFIGAAAYAIWFKGYSPLYWPIQLAWEGVQTVAAAGSEKVWLVAEFVDDNGRPAKMSFNNPALPDLTLAECEASINDARPHVLEAVRQTPGASTVTEITLSCIVSHDDPIRP